MTNYGRRAIGRFVYFYVGSGEAVGSDAFLVVMLLQFQLTRPIGAILQTCGVGTSVRRVVPGLTGSSVLQSGDVLFRINESVVLGFPHSTVVHTLKHAANYGEQVSVQVWRSPSAKTAAFNQRRVVSGNYRSRRATWPLFPDRGGSASSRA